MEGMEGNFIEVKQSDIERLDTFLVDYDYEINPDNYFEEDPETPHEKVNYEEFANQISVCINNEFRAEWLQSEAFKNFTKKMDLSAEKLLQYSLIVAENNGDIPESIDNLPTINVVQDVSQQSLLNDQFLTQENQNHMNSLNEIPSENSVDKKKYLASEVSTWNKIWNALKTFAYRIKNVNESIKITLHLVDLRHDVNKIIAEDMQDIDKMHEKYIKLCEAERLIDENLEDAKRVMIEVKEEKEGAEEVEVGGEEEKSEENILFVNPKTAEAANAIFDEKDDDLDNENANEDNGIDQSLIDSSSNKSEKDLLLEQISAKKVKLEERCKQKLNECKDKCDSKFRRFELEHNVDLHDTDLDSDDSKFKFTKEQRIRMQIAKDAMLHNEDVFKNSNIKDAAETNKNVKELKKLAKEKDLENYAKNPEFRAAIDKPERKSHVLQTIHYNDKSKKKSKPKSKPKSKNMMDEK